MIEEIIAMLDTLDRNLCSLWEIHLGHQPLDWLGDLEHIRPRLTELVRFYDELTCVRGHVSDIRRHMSDWVRLDPTRKEN